MAADFFLIIPWEPTGKLRKVVEGVMKIRIARRVATLETDLRLRSKRIKNTTIYELYVFKEHLQFVTCVEENEVFLLFA